MRKIKLFTAVCLALVAGVLTAAPEPSVPAAPASAKEQAQKLALPVGAVKIDTSSDALFGWYVQPTTGMRYLVYEWTKPAIINALNITTNQKVTPGRQMLIIVPEGRSKGKVKIDLSARVVSLNDAVYPSSTITPGTVIGQFQPLELAHDSVDNATATGEDLPEWGEAIMGLWKSTGIYDIIEQSSSDFGSTWTLGLGRVLMMLVALLLIYLAIVKEFEPLLLLPIGFGALLANIPLAGISGPDGLQGMIFEVGINTGVFPLLPLLQTFRKGPVPRSSCWRWRRAPRH